MINLTDADVYLGKHIEKDAWNKLTESEKLNSLEMAESYINSAFDLRDDVKVKTIYLHSICEQAIHLLVFDKARLKLQREGVSSYKVDDLSYQMTNSFISPIASAFLRKHSFKQLGEIV